MHFLKKSTLHEAELTLRPTRFESEADIVHPVGLAVKDAVDILEYEGEFIDGDLYVRLERSLFGCRPDLMVVRDRQQVGLLAVEVKQPCDGDKSLVEYPKVLGQAFDHAKSMNAFGQGTQLVILSSFDRSCLCSLEKSDLVGSDTEPHQGSKSVASTNVQSQSQSPPSNLPTVSNESPESVSSRESKKHIGASTNSFTIGGVERTMYHSQLYAAHDLVKLVYTALKTAKTEYNNSTKTIQMPEHGVPTKF